MMMRRTFLQRGKPVELSELTDLVAVRTGGGRKGNRSKIRISEGIDLEALHTQVRAFENAGWEFRERSAESPREATPQARVFVKPGDRLALGTNMLTVKLRESLSQEQADVVLQPYGCHVSERLTFAPGLFQTVCTDPAPVDTIGVAKRLMDSGLVQFAEPVLLEGFGPRTR